MIRDIRCASCTAVHHGEPLNEAEELFETKSRLRAELGQACPRGKATQGVCPMRERATKQRQEEYA